MQWANMLSMNSVQYLGKMLCWVFVWLTLASNGQRPSGHLRQGSKCWSENRYSLLLICAHFNLCRPFHMCMDIFKLTKSHSFVKWVTYQWQFWSYYFTMTDPFHGYIIVLFLKIIMKDRSLSSPIESNLQPKSQHSQKLWSHAHSV